MNDFAKERNEALTSLDKEKIMAYCNKYGITMPKNETIFWIAVHKSICNLFLVENSPITIKQYKTSYEWLQKHNSNPSIR